MDDLIESREPHNSEEEAVWLRELDELVGCLATPPGMPDPVEELQRGCREADDNWNRKYGFPLTKWRDDKKDLPE